MPFTEGIWRLFLAAFVPGLCPELSQVRVHVKIAPSHPFISVEMSHYRMGITLRIRRVTEPGHRVQLRPGSKTYAISSRIGNYSFAQWELTGPRTSSRLRTSNLSTHCTARLFIGVLPARVGPGFTGR